MLSAQFFVRQLRERLIQSAAVAQRTEMDARDAAKTMATTAEKKEDARAVLEFGSMAKAQARRTQQVQQDVRVLDSLCQQGLPRSKGLGSVKLGSLVDVATEDDEGFLERTFILLPVGGATELEGPGGDGYVTVITPSSPVGRAILGKRVGDVGSATVKGEPIEWEIVDVH